jgi:hypothetical protein
MTSSHPSSRPMSIHNVVLGVAIGLAILCAAITLVVVLERQRSEPGLAEAREELRASAQDLREATAALQAATRAPTTINVVGPPPPAAPPPAISPNAMRALDALGSAYPMLDSSPEPLPPQPSLYCPDPERCSIPRAVIEALLADPAGATKQARILPSVRDGVTVGLKLYGIRPGSLPRDLGIKNGDLLKTANGLPLSGVEQTMAAYTKLRRSDRIVLEIERKGETLRKEITIQ